MLYFMTYNSVCEELWFNPQILITLKESENFMVKSRRHALTNPSVCLSIHPFIHLTTYPSQSPRPAWRLSQAAWDTKEGYQPGGDASYVNLNPANKNK